MTTHDPELRQTQRRSGSDRRSRRCWDNYRGTVAYLALALALFFAIARNEDIRKDYQSALANSGAAVSTQGCNRDFRTIQKIRAILVRGENVITSQYETHQINQVRYQLGLKFYQEQLKTIDLPDCRHLKITASPNAKIVIPDPLYPGSAYENKALPGEKFQPLTP